MRWFTFPKTLISCSCYLFQSLAWAQDTANSAQPVSFDSISKLLLALILVLSVIVLAAWLFKRLNIVNALKSPYIQVQANQSLGTRERVVLLQVGDKQILLGVTPNQISALHVFSEQIKLDEEPGENTFAHKLSTLIKRAEK